MGIHSFYCPELQLDSQILELPSSEAHHCATVMRLKSGDEIRLMNGAGLTASAQIINVEKRRVSCRIINVVSHMRTCEIRLYVAPPRNKNMELLLKSATELGVARITPILCEYGVVKPDGDKESWRQAVIAACKQSGNPWLPIIDAPLSFNDALAQGNEIAFLGAVPKDARPFDKDAVKSDKGYALWIGPEGGFSQTETQQLLDYGAIPLTIGPYILRVETAVPALLGAIHFIISN